jgi:hypothetical protein
VKLLKLVEDETAELSFYCGGMANTDEVWDIFDKVIVLMVSDETTQERLSARQTGEFGNTQDNRDWVLSWKHDIEKRWVAAGGIAVSAEASPAIVATAVVNAVVL